MVRSIGHSSAIEIRMSDPQDPELDTTGGKFRLVDYRLWSADREWTILHTGAVLTEADEAHAVGVKTNRLPYGVSLWPSAIALAHEIATRADTFRGRSVLELGAGVGLPGIVAATLGARVVQTDRDELALHLCKRNGERNGVDTIEYRLADWTEWNEPGRHDWIIGSDILYGESLHPHIRRIFESNLAPHGRILLADPFRGRGIQFLETLEAEGWRVTFSKWDVGEETTLRPIGVFEMSPPG
jgi:methyltransferase-like protein 23